MPDSSEMFVPEIENMNLNDLKNKLFIVGVSTGSRDFSGVLPKTIRGPYNFLEMIGQVESMWSRDLNHPKVFILEKDRGEPSRWLDAKTVDYIIAKAAMICMEEIILKNEEEFTCEAGIVSEQ